MKNEAKVIDNTLLPPTSVQGEIIAPSPKKARVWEVDFLRGIMILLVVWDHTLNDIRVDAGGNYKTALFQALYTFSCNYSASALRAVCQPVIVTLFIFTAGLSCSFSKNNFYRSLKLMAVSIFLTLGGFVVSVVLKKEMIIYFNVIHVIALSVFLWSIVDFFWKKCVKNWQKNLFGTIMAAVVMTALVAGACAKYKPLTDENSAWFFLLRHSGEKYSHFTSMDYRSFFPDFGWFLIGAFLGRIIYAEKKDGFSKRQFQVRRACNLLRTQNFDYIFSQQNADVCLCMAVSRQAGFAVITKNNTTDFKLCQNKTHVISA